MASILVDESAGEDGQLTAATFPNIKPPTIASVQPD
jgi:hypothetical protein